MVEENSLNFQRVEDFKGKLMTVSEAAVRLGVSESLLYKLIKREQITHIRMTPSGRIIRFREEDLLDFVNRNGSVKRRKE